MENNGKPRQAVVVIHGVGEHMPMATLRGFAEGVVSSKGPEPHFVSHPDRVSKFLELLTLRASAESAIACEPVTDFYECCWSHRMCDTKLRHVMYWLVRLLFTPIKNARTLLVVYWSMAVALAVMASREAH